MSRFSIDWTPALCARIELLAKQGYNGNEIAAATGIGPPAIIRYLRSNNLGAPQASAEQRREEFAELLANGHDVVTASLAIGINPHSGRNILTAIKQQLGWQAQ